VPDTPQPRAVDDGLLAAKIRGAAEKLRSETLVFFLEARQQPEIILSSPYAIERFLEPAITLREHVAELPLDGLEMRLELPLLERRPFEFGFVLEPLALAPQAVNFPLELDSAIRAAIDERRRDQVASRRGAPRFELAETAIEKGELSLTAPGEGLRHPDFGSTRRAKVGATKNFFAHLLMISQASL
jgi:hypothetical protein